MFLILAAQYESWSLPVSVMMAIPFAILGALVAIALRGIDNDLYFQIGLLTLVGLAAKNAILIVEFAVELHRKEGLSLFDAAAEAARLRLRPIIMTSFAFVLGTLPLAIATGASANSRHSIGTGVIGGTLVATLVAIFFIPMFYWLVGTLSSAALRRPQGRRRDRRGTAPGTGRRAPGRAAARGTAARAAPDARGPLTWPSPLPAPARPCSWPWRRCSPAAWSAPTMCGPRSTTPADYRFQFRGGPGHRQHPAGGGSSVTRCSTT